MRNSNYLKKLFFFCFALLWASSSWAHAEEQTFYSISYHDVVDSRDQLTSDTVTIDTLINHFEWLKANDYHPISVDDLLAAQRGTKKLPAKAVLLSWDDGYVSFYTHVLPLLKAYKYPAVLALVGEWLSASPNERVEYGATTLARSRFLSWEQIQEISASNLVELASHSYGLHKEIIADAYGSKIPAAIAHQYEVATGQKETDKEMRQRIYDDLKKNSYLIAKYTGKKPRVMVWPFGNYNTLCQNVAADLGMKIALTLDDLPQANISQLNAVPRYYPVANPLTEILREEMLVSQSQPLRRFIIAPTEEIIDTTDPKEPLYSAFLDRDKSLKPSAVVLAPLVQTPRGKEALFTNQTYPLFLNKLTRLSWYTRARTGVATVLSLDAPLFKADSPQKLTRLFSDMGKNSFVDGLIVENHAAVEEILAGTTKPIKITGNEIKRPWNPNSSRKFRQQLLSKKPTNTLLRGVEAFQQWQPFLDIGVIISPAQMKERSLAKTASLLTYFDYIIIDARTDEQQKCLKAWLARPESRPLFNYIAVLFSYDQESDNGERLAERLLDLSGYGIKNWGYQIDSAVLAKPLLEKIRPAISVRNFPIIAR
ncbi:poly-beta-1,6-N-acetyl-D-glucosamine N-deacetylase PgaB [Desulfotalea psychrophila]|uniref:NodB homology domain-containing protein n=1 Tax=Desulfotalea psychrophila (strain LSv54 / DSM 12343) TaxID=177439 RepID=Q6AMR1_DESPS|nr:poly-beta-1,6-N-acetyl-D-glucosamine N-deacetylase PgaB [Desulfotalea psychrophila]CAG36364.1 hypothetical protein DP1635 [Desulfotalea psychrophila LSv54]